MKSPRLSVLMTVFNAESYLGAALESLSSQTFHDFEVVVLEHGSTDNSLEILNNWGDQRLNLETREVNIGRTHALNSCLMRSSGDYIAVLDADDLAFTQRFAIQTEFLTSHPSIGLVGSWTRIIDDSGNTIGSLHPPKSHEMLIRQMAVRSPIAHSSYMFRRKIALEIGGYDSTYAYAQDFNLLIEFAKRTKIAVIDRELCSWRRSNTGLTFLSAISVTRAYDEYRLFRKVSTDIKLDLKSYLLNKKHIFLTYILLQIELLRKGIYKSACRWIRDFEHNACPKSH